MANWELTIGSNARFLLTLRRQNEDGTAEVIRIGDPLDGEPARRIFEALQEWRQSKTDAGQEVAEQSIGLSGR